MKFTSQQRFKHDRQPLTGILLVNLGTPAAPTPAAVRRYLAEFLIDGRVVEIPKFIWWVILHGIILRLRPKRVAHAYASIWLDDGSPLMVYSQAITKALRERCLAEFGADGKDVIDLLEGDILLVNLLPDGVYGFGPS